MSQAVQEVLAGRPMNFQPSTEMLEAAQGVFQAIAHLQVVEPIVLGYQRLILKEAGWKARPDFASRGFSPNEVVKDPERAWLLNEANLTQYDQLCQRAQLMSGLAVTKPGNCPLSEAKSALVEAKMRVAQVMAPLTGIPAEKVCLLEREKFETYIDLSLRLLAPYLPGGERAGEDALEQVSTSVACATAAERPRRSPP